MSLKNYRIVNTERGYGVFEVYYDSLGSPIRRNDEPVLKYFSDTACGLSDGLESIQLAFEKSALEDHRLNDHSADAYMNESKKVCHTPTSGKQPTSIPVWKYTLLREIILNLVPEEPPGVAAKDLPELVREQLNQEDLEKLGSVAWHTTTVKLHMEVENELERVAGVKPQHIVRTL